MKQSIIVMFDENFKMLSTLVAGEVKNKTE